MELETLLNGLTKYYYQLRNNPASAQTPKAQLYQLFDRYYQESLPFDPFTATFLGDHRFDDQVANTISEQYLQKNMLLTGNISGCSKPLF